MPAQAARQYQTFPDAPGDSESLAKLKALRLPVLVGQRFLDIGCNEGLFCGYAQFAGASRVVGLDASQHYIERARKRFAGAEFLHQNWDVLPEGPFDVVLLASSLHYATDQAGLIERAVAQLAPKGTLVLELGVAPGEQKEWVEVQRGADKRLFPTWAQLHETLKPYAWKLIAESVNQKGDPVQRYVLHINARKPVAYLVLQPPGFGKTTLCKTVFKPAGIPVVASDQCLLDIADGKLACDEALRQLVAAKCSRDALDKTMLAILQAGLLPALVDVWLAKADGKTFALDAWVPGPQRADAERIVKERGYMAVTLDWERPGAELQASGKVVDMADAFFAELANPPEPESADTFSLRPKLPFKGTIGSLSQLGVSSERLELFGWAVHEDGRMPAYLCVRIGDTEHVVSRYDRRAVPEELQTRLGLAHRMFGFRFSIPVPKGVKLTDIPALINVYGGVSPAELQGPFSADRVRKDAARKTLGESPELRA